jgi:hypothetical protein
MVSAIMNSITEARHMHTPARVESTAVSGAPVARERVKPRARYRG